MTDIIAQAKLLAENVAKEIEAIREHRGGLSIEEFLDQTVLYRDTTATNVIEALAQETWEYGMEAKQDDGGWKRVTIDGRDALTEEEMGRMLNVYTHREFRIVRRRVSPSEVME